MLKRFLIGFGVSAVVGAVVTVMKVREEKQRQRNMQLIMQDRIGAIIDGTLRDPALVQIFSEKIDRDFKF